MNLTQKVCEFVQPCHFSLQTASTATPKSCALDCV